MGDEMHRMISQGTKKNEKKTFQRGEAESAEKD
jgi:hypothetical protein